MPAAEPTALGGTLVQCGTPRSQPVLSAHKHGAFVNCIALACMAHQSLITLVQFILCDSYQIGSCPTRASSLASNAIRSPIHLGVLHTRSVEASINRNGQSRGARAHVMERRMLEHYRHSHTLAAVERAQHTHQPRDAREWLRAQQKTADRRAWSFSRVCSLM